MMAAKKKMAKKTDKAISPVSHEKVPSSVSPALLGDIQTLIESARIRVSVGVNAELVMLHWHIGHRLREDILNSGRSVYGEKIIELVAQDLTNAYGRGFSEKSLRHMVRFADTYEDETIVSTLSRQLSTQRVDNSGLSERKSVKQRDVKGDSLMKKAGKIPRAIRQKNVRYGTVMVL